MPRKRFALGLTLLAAHVAACSVETELEDSGRAARAATLVDEVRQLAVDNDIGPLEPPPAVRPALVELGRALAFDPVLSGNRNISCMTCHLPQLGTTDALHLSIGQGGPGLGATIPRNAPPLFNLFDAPQLFWDGRVQFFNANAHNPNKIVTPAGTFKIHTGFGKPFELGTLSALALFPVMSREEMRGQPGENELAAFADDDFEGVWAALMTRLGAIDEYRAMFEAAYPGTAFEDMKFAHASNAIAGFIVAELSFTDTPWDRFLRGDDAALTEAQLSGATAFLTARCKNCHGGDHLSDFEAHNVALAQVGPGTGDGPGGTDDFGRFRVSGDPADRYAFRTPPLRNVELTAPFGHAGQFASLLDFIDHYSESADKLLAYDVTQLHESLWSTLVDNADAVLATRDPLLEGVAFPPSVVSDLTEFMLSLTDEAARDIEHVAPVRLPGDEAIP